MNAMASQITGVLIASSIVCLGTNKKIKALRHCPLWGESTGDRWIPPQKVSNAEMFPFDDVIM